MELRLLIVEDDRLIAEAAADYFTGKGWRVETTEDGVQALEMLEVQSFHLVLLDVMLPNRDGFAVCRQIRKSCDVPIIFITARVLEEDKLFATLDLGGLKVDTKRREVFKHGEIIPLPPKEYELLLFLIQNPGRVYSREQLLIRFWGYDFDGNERVVDNHIKKLRKALGLCGCTIDTVRKFGYRLSVVNSEVVQ